MYVGDFGEVFLMGIIALLLSAVFTSLVLADALHKPGTRILHRVLFYLVSIPCLYILIALFWTKIMPNSPNGVFFYLLFIIFFYLYLKVSRLIRNRRRKEQ
jgi:Ca2+/Na+ antiporter